MYQPIYWMGLTQNIDTSRPAKLCLVVQCPTFLPSIPPRRGLPHPDVQLPPHTAHAENSASGDLKQLPAMLKQASAARGARHPQGTRHLFVDALTSVTCLW